MTTRVIKIVIDSSGAKRGGKDVERSLSGVEKKSKDAGGALQGVKGALIATAAILVARKVIEIGDAYASLQGQLRLVTSGSAELENVTKSLFAIAQKTRQELGATADLYIRLGRSTDFSNERILQLTETIGQTIALSRATPAAAQAALFQLGQGFAAGALRGEELNSVLEQTPELAKAISDGLGVTLGQLRILGAQGALTAETVAEGLEVSAAKVDSEFGSLPLTVGDAVTRVGNSMTLFIGTLDTAFQATATLAQGINKVSEIIQGLQVILGDDKGFGAEAGRIGVQIKAAQVFVDEINRLLESRSAQNNPLIQENLLRELDAAKTKLEELKTLQFDIIANGGLTNAELELKSLEDLRASIALTIQKTDALFATSKKVNPLLKAIEDTESRIAAVQKRLEKGLIDPDEAAELEALLAGTLGEAAQRQADVFAESFRTAADKAKDSLALLNDFVERNLIPPEVADSIRERLTKAITGGDDENLVGKFVDQFKTASDKAKEQIEELDAFVGKNLIDEPTAQKIRDRLEAIVAKELIVEVKADVQAFQDAEQRIQDLRDKIQAFGEGGEDALSATDSFQQARDIIAELGDEATIGVQELTKLIETEKQLTKVIGDQQEELEKNATALDDFFRTARENSQDILADMFSDGFQNMDEFKSRFAQMLLDLASQALAAEIFNLILGSGDGGASGSSGGGEAGLITSLIGGLIGGGSALGNDFGKGDFGVVGEDGPEVFQAPTAGSVIPNPGTVSAVQGGPSVNVPVQVINVSDPSEIPAALQSDDSKQAILNMVSSNRSAFNSALGGAT